MDVHVFDDRRQSFMFGRHDPIFLSRASLHFLKNHSVTLPAAEPSCTVDVRSQSGRLMSREIIPCALYDNFSLVQHLTAVASKKCKMHLGSAVTRAFVLDWGAAVFTELSERVAGDILLGCDGCDGISRTLIPDHQK